MDRLSYATLERMGYQGYLLRHAPERVLQFGEGNFLRGFVDYFIDRMNESVGFDSKVVVVPPIPAGKIAPFHEQEGLYQLFLRGRLDGEVVDQRRVISCIGRVVSVYEEYDAFLRTAHNPDMRFIISNTTEAGIVYDPSCRPDDRPPASFPAKLTRLLWERYQAGLPGYIILPCELIADNGLVLRDCVFRHARDWALGADFLRWLERENTFCSTLVDRIVTGYPGKETAEALNRDSGVEDAAIVAAHMILAAKNAGVESCWLNFFDPEEAKRELGLPENEEVLMLMDLGYPAKGAGPLENHGKRKALSETVTFWGHS